MPRPSEKALRDLRRRLGPAPLKALFEVVAGPLAQPRTPGVRFRGLRTVAFDGCNSFKPRNMLTQLAEWTRAGFLTRTSAGTYALTTPP